MRWRDIVARAGTTHLAKQHEPVISAESFYVAPNHASQDHNEERREKNGQGNNEECNTVVSRNHVCGHRIVSKQGRPAAEDQVIDRGGALGLYLGA